MIKVQSNTATRTPLPAFLRGLRPESLQDLSWTDPRLGVSDAAWWPEDRQWAELAEGERYTDEVLTIDSERKVVISTRGVEPDPDYVPPEMIVPDEVEGWQAEVAMRATPVDPDSPESQSVWERVQDLISAMEDGIEKITAQTVLRRGRIRHDSPMLAHLAPLVPLSQERVGDLMRLAGSIEA